MVTGSPATSDPKAPQNPYVAPESDVTTDAERDAPGCRGASLAAILTWAACWAAGAALFGILESTFSARHPMLGHWLMLTWLGAGLFASIVPAGITAIVHQSVRQPERRMSWTVATSLVSILLTLGVVLAVFAF